MNALSKIDLWPKQWPTKKLAPSLLSANWASLYDSIMPVMLAGADWLHIDVMDQHYVPNLSMGPKVLVDLCQAGWHGWSDVHLMVTAVEPLVMAFAEAGANSISFHPDAVYHPHRVLQMIRGHGLAAGLACNPGLPLDGIFALAEAFDYLLLMLVNPGFGGQHVITSQYDQLQKIARWRDQHAPHVAIQVDGGLNIENIPHVLSLGADIVVVGSAIFQHDNPVQATKELVFKIHQQKR